MKMTNLNNFPQIITFAPANITFYLHLPYDLWKCYFYIVMITLLALTPTKSNLMLKKKKKKERGEKAHVNKYTYLNTLIILLAQEI